MAWAASPSKTKQPENQRRRSTRLTVLTSRSSKDDTLSKQVRHGGNYPSPLPAEAFKIAARYRISRRGHVGCSPEVDPAAT
jgi:hypothetical protein